MEYFLDKVVWPRSEADMSVVGLETNNVDVLVVGAGLSGLSLAKEMASQGVNCHLVDTRSGTQDFKSAMYLISSVIAREWNLGEKLVDGKRPIVGYKEYDASTGLEIDRLGPILSGGIGFTPVSQYRMEKRLRDHEVGEKISWGATVERLAESGDGVDVVTNRGHIKTKVVVDATGCPAAVTKMAGKREGDYLIRALRGENCRAAGHDSRLIHFVKGLNKNEGNWLLPLGEKGAEVIAGQVMPVSGANEWWDKYSQRALEELVDWYDRRLGIVISLPEDSGKNMAFRVDPAPASQFGGRVIPFGEAAGLNSPIHGQLIDVLPSYTRTLVGEIVRAKESGEWTKVGINFYRKFLTEPPYLYLVHCVLLENRIRGGSRTGGINRLIYKILREEFDDFSLWRILQEGGLKLEDVIRLSIKRPREMTGFIIGSAPALVHLLVTKPELYIQFVATMPKRIASLANGRLGSFATWKVR